MKTEIFELQFEEWVRLSEEQILKRDWEDYHFINLFNDDGTLKGLGVYMKSKPRQSLREIFENDPFSLFD